MKIVNNNYHPFVAPENYTPRHPGNLRQRNQTAFTPTSEIEALSTFYHSTHGPSWVVNEGWSTLEGQANVTDPCGAPTWHGVTCVLGNDGFYHVVSIALRNNGMSGTLPSESLAKLDYLEALDLGNQRYVTLEQNQVHGPVPSSLPQSLVTLSLAYNNITSSIPSTLRLLTNLEVLDLDYNALLSGSLPDVICSFSAMKEMHFRGNSLDTTIPDCIGSCTDLEYLDITSVTSEGYVPGDTVVRGTLPESICSLSKLTALDVQYTQSLVGTIPACLGAGQPHMTVVALMGNGKLSGSVPEVKLKFYF